MDKDMPLADQLAYIRGEVAGVKALILGLANQLLDRETFREESLRRIEVAKTAMLSTPTREAFLDALDDTAKWVQVATS